MEFCTIIISIIKISVVVKTSGVGVKRAYWIKRQLFVSDLYVVFHEFLYYLCSLYDQRILVYDKCLTNKSSCAGNEVIYLPDSFQHKIHMSFTEGCLGRSNNMDQVIKLQQVLTNVLYHRIFNLLRNYVDFITFKYYMKTNPINILSILYFHIII